MTQVKFLPEVARNRLFSNWVLARFGPKRSESDTKRSLYSRLKAIRLPIICLFLVLSASVGYFGIPKRSTSFESVIAQPPATAASTSDSVEKPLMTDCSADDLQANLADYAPTRDGIKAISGYKALPGQDLGGALVIDFVCEDSKTIDAFRSIWLLVDKKWSLKEISRPPSRQPGDF